MDGLRGDDAMPGYASCEADSGLKLPGVEIAERAGEVLFRLVTDNLTD